MELVFSNWWHYLTEVEFRIPKNRIVIIKNYYFKSCPFFFFIHAKPCVFLSSSVISASSAAYVFAAKLV